MKAYKKTFYFTLGVLVLVILLIAGRHLLTTVLTVLGLWLGRKITEEEKKIDDEIKEQHQDQKDLFARAERLMNKYVKLKKSSERRKEGRHNPKFPVIILIILVSFGAMTSDLALATDDLYIPENYEELRELYILADQEVRARNELITEYQVLIEDYQNSLRKLNALVNRLQEISEEKDMTIAVKDELIAVYEKPAWGLTGGLVLGERLGYTLGIIRLHDWWGWQVYYLRPGSLSLGLSLYY